jgi:hypothetical protein
VSAGGCSGQVLKRLASGQRAPFVGFGEGSHPCRVGSCVVPQRAPIALRRKKSLSPMADSIAIVSSSTSARSHVPSWQMIDARRSHRPSLRVHVSKAGRTSAGHPQEQVIHMIDGQVQAGQAEHRHDDRDGRLRIKGSPCRPVPLPTPSSHSTRHTARVEPGRRVLVARHRCGERVGAIVEVVNCPLGVLLDQVSVDGDGRCGSGASGGAARRPAQPACEQRQSASNS